MKNRVDNGGVFVSLVKGCQGFGIETLALVISVGLDGVVVESDSLVGVPDRNVESQVVVEGVVGGEIELGQ